VPPAEASALQNTTACSALKAHSAPRRDTARHSKKDSSLLGAILIAEYYVDGASRFFDPFFIFYFSFAS
jgi:hypothetical protein